MITYITITDNYYLHTYVHVHAVMCRAIQVIDLFFNFRLYVRLQVREISNHIYIYIARSHDCSWRSHDFLWSLPPVIFSFLLQRFIYDFRLLKGDYNDSCHGALERLASSNAFELAMAQIKQSHPPADLSGLQSAASPKEISDNLQ
jgi:hypothetical protein